MELNQAIKKRHSVRQYMDKKIGAGVVTALQAEIDACNAAGDLHIQLVTDEPKAFGTFMAHYGKFSGVSNYLAMVGKKGADLEERAGFYGERIVLLAQTLGLNTCWVAATFGKGAAKKNCQIEKNEKLVCVIAIGYGASKGVPHKSKPLEALYKATGDLSDWFRAGMEAAALAPTAVNQQKFLFTLSGDTVTAASTGGPYSQVDLGIVKCHFAIGAGEKNFKWA